MEGPSPTRPVAPGRGSTAMTKGNVRVMGSSGLRKTRVTSTQRPRWQHPPPEPTANFTGATAHTCHMAPRLHMALHSHRYGAPARTHHTPHQGSARAVRGPAPEPAHSWNVWPQALPLPWVECGHLADSWVPHLLFPSPGTPESTHSQHHLLLSQPSPALTLVTQGSMGGTPER